VNRISHWIDGAVVEGTSGQSGRVFNPATGEQAASVDFASVAEVDGKVDTVLSRGRVIVQDDTFKGAAGHGQYIKRGLSQYLV